MPCCVQVLRLGVFELTERQLPPHALNEHVQLAKALVRPGVGSFVNGVLRSAGRHLEAGTLPTPEVGAGRRRRAGRGGKGCNYQPILNQTKGGSYSCVVLLKLWAFL